VRESLGRLRFLREASIAWWEAACVMAARRCIMSPKCRLSSRFEELDWIPVGIFYLDLSAARTSFYLIAKPHPRALQRVNPRGQVRHTEYDSIPSARLLGFASGHRPRSGRPGPSQQQDETSERTLANAGRC
jgi:hypothetical protein